MAKSTSLDGATSLEDIENSAKGSKPESKEDDGITSLTEGLHSVSIRVKDVDAIDAPEAIKNVADLISSNKYKNIVVLTGAGISCNAGIPDFRTEGTGLYDNLQKYNLPFPGEFI